jgi:hypothetical protein
MKKLYFLFFALMATSFTFAQGTEDFTNSAATSSYTDGSFVGNGGITWTYVASRAAESNNGGNPTSSQLPALMLRRTSNDSKITSSTISGGIGDFSVKLYKQFTGGGDRQVELFVNGVSQGTSTGFDDYDEHVFTVSGINIGGDVIIEIRNITAKQVAIDDITWTAYAGAATPMMTITAPTAGQIFAPSTTSTDVTFTVQNYNIGSGMGEGHIVYTVDGGSAVDKFDTTPINLTGLTRASHTVNMELVDENGAPLSPAVTASVTFAVADYVTVADIAALRASVVDGYYHLTGEIFATAGELYTSGNIKGYAQDVTGGIMAFIPTGTTTNVINEGDGMTGFKGKLIDYHGVLELEVTEDFTMTGNNTPQTPEVVTVADLNATPDNYESKLIRINGGTVDPGSDANFTRNHNYDLTVGTDVTVLRAAFSNLDGVAFPTGTVDVVGIGSEYNGTAQIFPRDGNDLIVAGAISENNINGFRAYPNPVTNGHVFVTSNNDVEKQVIIYDVLGKVVISTDANNNEAINISQLKTGIYMMKVIEEGHVALHKLMIK